MIKIKFNSYSEMIDCTFEKVSDNIIRLYNGLESTEGFLTYRMDGITQLGDFSDFTTIYNKTDDYVEYSNDGSVKVLALPTPELPETPIDPQPTLVERVEELETANADMLYQICLLQLGMDADTEIPEEGGGEDGL